MGPAKDGGQGDVDIRPFNVLSLCSGVGGLELGLELAVANARPVCYVEREAYAAEVLAARIAEGFLADAPIWTDLATFDGAPWRGVVDCIAAGFPCQPVSVAGKRRAQEDDRWIWPDIARIIREVEPRFVFLENVPGLLIRGLGDVLGDLATSGYDAEWGVFSAAGVGAPHLRERVFILAYLAEAGCRTMGFNNKDRWWQEAIAGTDSAAVPVFPPAPNDGAWVYVIERWPWLAPAVANRNSGKRRPDGREADAETDRGNDTRRRGEALENSTRLRQHGQIRQDGGRRGRDGETGDGRNEHEAAQPAVRRMADGLPYRVDQLRALGNGVVPVVAAVAFLTLTERLRCLTGQISGEHR